MAIFNSLGSNYNFSFVLRSLIFRGKKRDKEELEEYLQKKYEGKVFLVYKGREAITLALELAKLPKDSFVAINGFTCFAVFEAIKNARLNIEYLDIEKNDLNFSADELERKLSKNKKIRAVIAQNTLGYPCKIEEISKICKKNNLVLIEDLAHSVGTIYSDGREAGKAGDFTILSFSQDKVIDAIMGGALIIRNSKFTSRQKIIAEQSNQKAPSFYPLLTFIIRKTYSVYVGRILHFIFKKINILSNPMASLSKGFVHGLSNYFASLALIQFKNLETQLEHRRKISVIYKNNLPDEMQIKNASANISRGTNLRFPILLKGRKKLVRFLKEYGFYISDIWYDSPVAPKKYLQITDYKNQCQVSEKISSEILNLPTHINVSQSDALKICQLINKWKKLQ